MTLFLILTLIAFSLAIATGYSTGYARGFRVATMTKDFMYANAYKQVLQISTDEQKKRLDDQVEAQQKMCEAIRSTNDAAIATHFQSKGSAQA